MLTIDVGYFFEGVGLPLGGSSSAADPDAARAAGRCAGRAAGTSCSTPPGSSASIGSAGPGWAAAHAAAEALLLGFDEQKLETEGIPKQFFAANPRGGRGRQVTDESGLYRLPRRRAPADGLVVLLPAGTALQGPGRDLVPVRALARRAPRRRRSRAAWADELVLATVPVVVLFAMSFLTDINLGLRYVLPILPYVFISTGKVVPWASGLRHACAGSRLRAIVGGSLGLTVAASL